MTLGQKIKKARQEKGITQERFAELIDCSRTIVQWYESGKRKPTEWRLLLIAETLGVKMEELKDDGRID